MTALDRAINDLVIANRILAHEGAVDAYGHVSLRRPDDPGKYLLSRSLSPEHVAHEDILEFTPGQPPGRRALRSANALLVLLKEEPALMDDAPAAKVHAALPKGRNFH